MKKYFKKLGIISLIVALLAPYIYIPEVKAETATTGCTQHLNTYLFMDKSKIQKDKKGNIWLEKLVTKEGSKTWANVPISIPTSTSTTKVTIKSVEKNNLTEKEDLENFWQLYVDNTERLSELKILEKYGETFTNYQNFLQNSNSKYKMSDYESISAIFHGKWSNDSFEGKEQENNYDDNITTVEDGVNLSLQTKFPKDIVDKMNVSFASAKFNNTYSDAKYFVTPSNAETLTADYFQELIDGKKNDYTYDNGNQTYFSTTVYRTVGLSDDKFHIELNNLVYGGKRSEFLSNEMIESEDFKDAVYLAYYEYNEAASSQELKHSYTGLQNGTLGHTFGELKVDESKIDIDIFTPYYWPAVINVEYEVCPVENPATPPENGGDNNNVQEKWYVNYESNLDGVTVLNMPSKHTENLGTNSKVATGTPTAEGYAFKGWCVGSKECTSTVKEGDPITSPTKAEETVTLYAQWGKTGPEEQEKTGVVSYVLGFAAVGLIAGGIYLATKKKNIFTQI